MFGSHAAILDMFIAEASWKHALVGLQLPSQPMLSNLTFLMPRLTPGMHGAGLSACWIS